MISKLIFDDYRFDELYFQANQKYKEPPEGVDLTFRFEQRIDLGVDKEKGTRYAMVWLRCHVWENAKDLNYPFTARVSIVGNFHTEDPMSDEEFERFCRIPATAALFPFIRSALATITSTANVNTLLLPLINVVQMFENLETHESEAATENRPPD